MIGKGHLTIAIESSNCAGDGVFEIGSTKGQTIRVSSPISNQMFDYFLPAFLRDISIDERSAENWRTMGATTESATACYPLLYVIASRGAMIGSDVLESVDPIEREHMRRVTACIEWAVTRRAAPLAENALKDLHSGIVGEKMTAYRSALTWIGGDTAATASLVPPPSSAIPEYVADLIEFLGNERIPGFLRLAMAHAQILLLHPFKDGNGRLARALVAVCGGALGVSAARGAAMAAALTWHRLSLVPLIRSLFYGDAGPFLRFWLELGLWADEIVSRATESERAWQLAVSGKLGDLKRARVFVEHFKRDPVIDSAQLRTMIDGSEKLFERYIKSLTHSGALVERKARYGTAARSFECPDALQHWIGVQYIARQSLDAKPLLRACPA